MLRLFGGAKSDHPLADLEQARRLLAGLRAGDAVSALVGINRWFEAVRAEQDFRADHRAALGLLLDEAAQAPLCALEREYLSTSPLAEEQKQRIWGAVYAFWRNATLAFVGSLEAFVTGAKGTGDLRARLPLLTVRALRALAGQMKWLNMRYAPVDPQLWRMAVGSHSLAEARRYARASVAAYPGVPGATTPEQEFLRVLMPAVCSPESLLPLERQLCERLIGHFASRFVLTDSPRGDTPYWVDLARGIPPARHSRPPPDVKSLRYFGAGGALAEIDALVHSIATTGEVPASLALDGEYRAEQVLRVLRHAAAHWSPAPRERRHARYRAKSGLTVARGFDGVLDALGPRASRGLDGDRLESWIAENVGAGGLSALVPQGKSDGLRVGVLLAVQPEGGENWLLGVVRRISRARSGDTRVGIQTLSRYPSAVEMHVHAGETFSIGSQRGILLAHARGTGETEVVLRPGVHVAGRTLVFDRAGRRTELLTAGVAERGADYELLRCRDRVVQSG